ncbi:MAG: UDP-N-acetylmuramoyl-L-alanyl-D-glutamate--2,6-diaminopimelate ligase [Planctomycetota bacterium]|jgi:UDP-N-acetylmuramoyl-L-alanyl-D-glutamate--2,6-diaminopimelate ligase
MKLSLLGSAVPGARVVPTVGSGDPDISDVVLDSRQVTPGSLFVAVRGTAVDGHDHIDGAYARGAAAVAVERPVRATAARPHLLVRDGRRAAGRLAAALLGHPTRDLDLIGITGTNGKTTTSYLLRAILAAHGADAGLVGTIEVDTGVRRSTAALTTPDAATLQQLFDEVRHAGHTAAVMEVSSHALVQGRTDAADFNVGVLTNVRRDHLDYHKSIAAYRAAKGLLFNRLRRGAHAVLNADDPATPAYAASTAAQVWRYGTQRGSDVAITQVRAAGIGTALTLATPFGTLETMLQMVGRVNAWNAAAAATAAMALDIPIDTIARGLALMPGVPGRLEYAGRRRGVTVLVDYAHTPDALEAALRSVRELANAAPRALDAPHAPRGAVRCVFGCGGDRDRGKRPPMAEVVGRLADVAYLTSDNPRTEDPERILDDAAAGFAPGTAFVRTADRAAAIARAITEARPGDWVLIAGKGHETLHHARAGSAA